MDNRIHNRLYGHVAVRVKGCIIVFGGKSGLCENLMTEIRIYNLYTEHWRKYYAPQIPECPPSSFFASAVAIGSAIYMYDAGLTWKLTKCKDFPNKPQCLWTWYSCKLAANGWVSPLRLKWSKIQIKNDKEPSPCRCQSGWEHNNKLWIFGGYGNEPTGYLSDHVEFLSPPGDNIGYNNQFLCFDPVVQEWENLQCSGSIPSPRCYSSTAVVRNTVWLYGGMQGPQSVLYDLYHLDMQHLTWTEIEIKEQILLGFSSLTAVTDTQLVLYGGESATQTPGNSSPVLIFDTLSKSCKHKMIENPPRVYHSSTVGLNGSVIVLGGKCPSSHYEPVCTCNNPVFKFSLIPETKSLQHLAIRTIYHHYQHQELSLEALPKKLVSKIMGTEFID